ITRREVEAAKNAGKDVLVWIVDDNFPWTEKKEQDLLADPNVLADPARVTEVAEHVAALIDFKAWLRTTFTPDIFTNPDNLGSRIATALANYVIGHAAPKVPQDKISIARLPTTWFGDTDPTAGSPWDKGERLAGYIRQSRRHSCGLRKTIKTKPA